MNLGESRESSMQHAKAKNVDDFTCTRKGQGKSHCACDEMHLSWNRFVKDMSFRDLETIGDNRTRTADLVAFVSIADKQQLYKKVQKVSSLHVPLTSTMALSKKT